MSESLPAIKAAEDLLMLAWRTPDEEIQEALKSLRTAGSTWGILWGLENLRRSGMDAELYELKEKALRFMAELRADKRFPLVVAIQIGQAREATP